MVRPQVPQPRPGSPLKNVDPLGIALTVFVLLLVLFSIVYPIVKFA